MYMRSKKCEYLHEGMRMIYGKHINEYRHTACHVTRRHELGVSQTYIHWESYRTRMSHVTHTKMEYHELTAFANTLGAMYHTNKSCG